MKQIVSYFIVAMAAIVSSTSCYADGIAPGIAVFPFLEAPGADKEVSGRFSWFFGRHAGQYGLDIGLLGNITDKEFVGLAISGAFNATNGKAIIGGLQFAGLTNVNSGNTYVCGVELAGGLNINKGQGFVAGAQVAALGNIAPQTKIYGLQAGLYNRADKIYGFQIGLLNVANTLHGFQLGLLNINRGGPLVYFPVINAGF